MAVCTALGLLASFQIKSSAATEYEAQAVLLVSPPTNAGGTTTSYDPDRYIATQLSQLKNIALADRVANQLGGGLTTDQVDLAVRVQQRPKTEIVDLFATSTSPEQAQNLANTYVDIYIADLKDKAGGSKSDEVKSLQDQYDALDKKIQELDQQIATETPPGATIVPIKVVPLISQRNSLSKQQDKILETKTSLELLQKLKVTTEIQQRAILPTHTKAKSKKLLIAGVLGGPMLGLALALVTARFSSRVIDTSQVEDVLGQPIAVRIRRLRGLSGPRPELMRSLPGAAEGSVDLLCVRAEANAEPTKALRVAVIGTEHGAGSTTLAVAMAGRFARKGSTVVLVDADQNDPEISEAFHTGGDAGLPALLARVDRISEIKMTGVDRRRGTTHAGNRPVFTTIDPDLRVLGLGPKLGNTVLRRSNVPALLDRLANEAQVIVFDAGPLLDAATTVQLSLAVDAVVLAVPHRRQRLSSLEAVARQLQNRNGELLPVMMSPHRRHRLALPFGTPKATMVDTSDEVSSTEVTATATAASKPTAVANGNGTGNGSRKRAGNILDAREARLNQTALRDASHVASDEQVSEPTVTTPTTDD